MLSAVRVCDMRTGITVTVSPADHDRLTGIVSEGNSPPKHVWRAEIVLSIAEGEGSSAIMSATGKSKTAVGRWQERFIREGVESLLHDPGTAPIEKTSTSASAGLRWVLKLISNDWTLLAMAKVAGVAASTVHQIWRAHGLAPHRWRHCLPPLMCSTEQSGEEYAAPQKSGIHPLPQ